MPEVKWIKLVTDMFDNRKIRQIETMPDADSILVIWLKLLCLAGKVNECGAILFTADIPYTDEMLSKEFDRPMNTVRLALTTFERFGMIELTDSVYHVSNWEKYQNTDKLSEIREYNRIAQQKSREKRKSLPPVNDMSMTCQPCQGTDKDIDKEVDKEVLPVPKQKPPKEEKTHYAEFVLMTETEYGKLVGLFGQTKTDGCVTILDNYKGASGKTYKSDYRAILNWVDKRYDEDNGKKPGGMTPPPMKEWN